MLHTHVYDLTALHLLCDVIDICNMSTHDYAILLRQCYISCYVEPSSAAKLYDLCKLLFVTVGAPLANRPLNFQSIQFVFSTMPHKLKPLCLFLIFSVFFSCNYFYINDTEGPHRHRYTYTYDVPATTAALGNSRGCGQTRKGRYIYIYIYTYI